MKRYILKFSNGKLRQQDGINGTYHDLLGIGAIDWIIDTKKGAVMIGNKDQSVTTREIDSFDSSDLIVEKD